MVTMNSRKSINELGGNRSASNAVDFAFVAAAEASADTSSRDSIQRDWFDSIEPEMIKKYYCLIKDIVTQKWL